MDVTFYFDPVCTWTWQASRWLIEVASRRELQLRWRGYSRLLGSGTRGLPDEQVMERVASHRALRVLEAVRGERPEAVRNLYEALVWQARADRAKRRQPFTDLRGALAVARLDPGYAAAASQECWDELIVRSMEEVHAVLGERVDVPAVVVARARPVGFCCPKISPMPTGTAALALWDARLTRARQRSTTQVAGEQHGEGRAALRRPASGDS